MSLIGENEKKITQVSTTKHNRLWYTKHGTPWIDTVKLGTASAYIYTVINKNHKQVENIGDYATRNKCLNV